MEVNTINPLHSMQVLKPRRHEQEMVSVGNSGKKQGEEKKIHLHAATQNTRKDRRRRRRSSIKRKQLLLFCILRNWVLLFFVVISLIALIVMVTLFLQPCSNILIPYVTEIVDTLQTRNVLEYHTCYNENGSYAKLSPTCNSVTSKTIDVIKCTLPKCLDIKNQTTHNLNECRRTNCTVPKCILYNKGDNDNKELVVSSSLDGDASNICMKYSSKCFQMRTNKCIITKKCQSKADQSIITNRYCKNITNSYCRSQVTNMTIPPSFISPNKTINCPNENVCSICFISFLDVKLPFTKHS